MDNNSTRCSDPFVVSDVLLNSVTRCRGLPDGEGVPFPSGWVGGSLGINVHSMSSIDHESRPRPNVSRATEDNPLEYDDTRGDLLSTTDTNVLVDSALYKFNVA